MKRQIVVTNDEIFMKYVKTPMISDDVDSYEVVYDVGTDLTGCSFQVTAIRNGAGNVTDLGTVEGTVARYTLKNNMYAILGNLSLRLTIISEDGETLTSKELACQVIPGNGTNNIEGDDRYPVLTQLILEMQEAKIHLEEQIEELHEYSDNAAEQAKERANAYTDEEIEGLDDKFDVKGAADTAETSAKNYTDYRVGNIAAMLGEKTDTQTQYIQRGSTPGGYKKISIVEFDEISVYIDVKFSWEGTPVGSFYLNNGENYPWTFNPYAETPGVYDNEGTLVVAVTNSTLLNAIKNGQISEVSIADADHMATFNVGLFMTVKEYADGQATLLVERLVEHQNAEVIDHPNGSVTTTKLADRAVTFEKLSDDIIEDLPDVGEHIVKLKTDDELRGELMAKVPTAIEDDVATFNDDGSVEDSGKKLSQFIEYTDTTALKKLLADALPDTNNFPAMRFTSKIPASGSDDGFKGEISFDSGNLYICVADDSWKKVALSDI